MKKLLLLVTILLFSFASTACVPFDDEETCEEWEVLENGVCVDVDNTPNPTPVTCELGELVEDGACIDDPDTEVFNEVLYDILFEDENVTLYFKSTPLYEDGEDVKLYTGEQYEYYLDGEIVHLNFLVNGTYTLVEALEVDLVTIDFLVTELAKIEDTGYHIIAIDLADLLCTPGQVYVDGECGFDYSYSLDDIPQTLQLDLGDWYFSWISQWFETDYDLDGEVSYEEWEQSYDEMLEDYGPDHIVTLSNEVVADMSWCIDSAMDVEYQNAAIYAIDYFNGIEWANLTYVIQDDCSGYDFTYTWITAQEVFDEAYLSYIMAGYDQEIATEMATDFSTNAIAYNSLMLDWENENYHIFGSTNIYFIVDNMVDLDQNEFNFVATHELGHSFGLDDIYDENFIGHSLMYGALEGQEELVPILRPFDLYNLDYIYNSEEDQE